MSEQGAADLAEAAWQVWQRQNAPVSPAEQAPEVLWKCGFHAGRATVRVSAWIYCTLATVITLFTLIAWAVAG